MGKSITTNPSALSDAALRAALLKIQTALCDVALTTGGLAIGSTSKKEVKIASTVYALIDGVLVKKTTAEVAFTATTHDVANGKFALFILSLKADGTVTITKSADADSLAEITVPTVPTGEAVIGAVIINPTGTGAFDATTTDLDDATVVPNAVYINTTYPFGQNALSL